MSIIDDLIFDRTNQDLTNDTDKAYIAYTDLNRIEQACQYLADILGVEISTKTWQMSDFRTVSEMERIRQNMITLRNAYYQIDGMTTMPAQITYTSINQANDIERILWELNDLYESVQSGQRRLSFVLGRKPFGIRRS